MMRKLIMQLICLFSAQSAFANVSVSGNGTTPVIHFQNHSPTGTEIIWTRASNIPSTDDAYDFVPTKNDTNPSHYINNYPSAGYTYSPPKQQKNLDSPRIDDLGFLAAIQNDVLVTENPKLSFELGGILPLLHLDMLLLKASNKPLALQSHWKSLVQNYSAAIDGGKGTLGSWLDSNVQKMIINHAKTYNVPILELQNSVKDR